MFSQSSSLTFPFASGSVGQSHQSLFSSLSLDHHDQVSVLARSRPASPIRSIFTDLRHQSSPPPSAAFNDSFTPLHFTPTNKMSLFSLEKRIDYHLSRIMKGHRLINFKNSIERLSTEKRICECIIEVLMSSMNLISRKAKIAAESKTMVEQLNRMSAQLKTGQVTPQFDSIDYCQRYMHKLTEVKTLAIGLEQIIWALNSNKEHIKYIVKVFTVPERYQRSEFAADQSSIVPLRKSITQTIEQCEEVITVCRLLRGKLSDALISWFISHF